MQLERPLPSTGRRVLRQNALVAPARARASALRPLRLLTLALISVGALACREPVDAGHAAAGATTSRLAERPGGAASRTPLLSPTPFTPESATTVAGPLALQFEPTESTFEGVLTLTLAGSQIFRGPTEDTQIKYAANIGGRTYVLLATNSGGSGCAGVFYVLAVDEAGRWIESAPFADCLHFIGAAAEADGIRLTFGGGPEGPEEVQLQGRPLQVLVERPERDAILALPVLDLTEDEPVLLRGRFVHGTADTGPAFELERRMRARGCVNGPIDSLPIDEAVQRVSELKGMLSVSARVACPRSGPIIVELLQARH